jgi:hypothetical protein
MPQKLTLDDLLAAHPRDSGCDQGLEVINQYVELDLAGDDPAARFPGVAVHLRCCPGCRVDYEGLLDLCRAELR